MKVKKSFVFGVIGILSATVLVVGCSKKNSDFNPMDMPSPVRTGKVITANVPVYINSFGILQAEYSADVKSQVSGQIESVNFKEGQFVKKGDILFTIDPRLYQAAVNQAKATLDQDKFTMSYNKYMMDKNNSLSKVGAMSPQDYQKLVSTYFSSQAQVESDEAQLKTAEINLEYCKITAPIDGITGVIQVDPGNVVTANSGPALVNIKTIDPMEIMFTIPERNIDILRNSMAEKTLQFIVTTINVNEDRHVDDKAFTGTLELVDNSINNTTGTIPLKGSIPNSDKKLWPGEFVKVKLNLFTQKNAILVPSLAVNNGNNGDYIFKIEKNNTAKLLWIKTGLTYGDYVEVKVSDQKEKINDGDVIATVGQLGLRQGCKIVVVGSDTYSLNPVQK